MGMLERRSLRHLLLVGYGFRGLDCWRSLGDIMTSWLTRVRALLAAGYEVTRDGRVLSHSHNWRGYGSRELKQHLNSHGYPRVRLTIEGKRKSFMVHKLVAELYVGERPSSSHGVCHRDDVKTNNHADNLYWGTPADNARDRKKHGRCYMTKNASELSRKSHERR